MSVSAVDYETYYDSECSITKGLENYLNHPKFDAYMVSIYSDDGFAWVGPPEDAPWDRLEGDTILSHNRNFDEYIHEYLVTTEKIPPTNFGEWHCTADMSSHHGWGRSLKEALKNSVGVLMKKEIRDAMKGRGFDELEPDEKKDLATYALYDSKGCLTLWNEGEKDWSELERKLSRETSRMCRQGLPIDTGVLDSSVSQLKNVLADALDTLPWATEKKGALSPKKFGEWCRKEGMEPPASTAKTDSLTLRWMEEHEKGAQVLEAMHTLRGANALFSKMQKMKNATRESDNRLPFPCKYFGGHTGRDSGGSDSERGDSFNAHNFPRGELYGVNLRSCIAAPAGKKLLIADLAQIEARCAMWLAGERDMLDEAAKGVDWYEAMARSFGLYSDPRPLKETNPDLRHTMKMQVLGCQFRMGVGKFASVSGVEYEEAQSMVRMFRANVPNLVKLWNRLEREMRSAGREEDGLYTVQLPSGRIMRYHDVQTQHGLSAMISKHGRRIREGFWSGKIMENITQAFARDVFMDRVIALVEGGHNVVLRVHDEVLIETDQDNAKDAAKDVHHIMTTPPDWCTSLPLGTEVEIVERYKK